MNAVHSVHLHIKHKGWFTGRDGGSLRRVPRVPQAISSALGMNILAQYDAQRSEDGREMNSPELEFTLRLLRRRGDNRKGQTKVGRGRGDKGA